MPPNNGMNGSTSQPSARKRPASSRVLPAIPLALSKPKPVRPPPKQQTESSGRAGATSLSTQAVTVEGADSGINVQEDQASVPAVNGEEHRQAESNDDVQEEDAVHDLTGAPVRTPGSRGSVRSIGATPELPPAESMRPWTPPPAITSDATAQGSPSSARKPTDKFDMRPLRTELPPAFVPSGEQHTPRSTTSSARPISQAYPNAHPHRPSTSSIMFGGYDSSTSSPAPPQSAGSGFQPPQYPTFGAAQPTQFFPPNHAHHTSEPYMQQRMFHQGHGPSNMPWSLRQGYPSQMSQPPAFQPHAHQQFRYPPREVFTPASAQQQNGHYFGSRSPSRSSSSAPKAAGDLRSPTADREDGMTDSVKTMFPEPKAAFAPGPPHLRHHQAGHQMHLAPQMPLPDMSASQNAEALRDHVQTHFANPLLADCHLQVVEDHEGARQYLDSHKMILSRSTTLLALIQNSDAPASASLKTQVHVRLRGPYVKMRAFMEGIRFLYGGPLLPLYPPRHPSGGPESAPNNEERMENALQYIATGAWLKVPAMAARGVDVAMNLLRWDTMTSLLAFALDGGLSPVWMVDDGSEDKVSCSSSDDSLGRSEATGVPMYDPYATQLLHRTINFTVHMFPPNFYLDASAPQLASCPRLPSLSPGHESRTSRSDPRLSRIRFGEVPTDDHQRPSIVTTTISSMLLSLPFALLKCILEHDVLAARLGADTVASIMRQVVAEREVRRTKALKARPASRVEDGVEAHLAQSLYWEEEVEASVQHRVGFRLARRRRGIETPPSSGAASERT